MFNLFRRRGRSSKEEKQTKNVAKVDETAANPHSSRSTSGEEFKSQKQFLKHGARASWQKVNLDSTPRQKETPPKSLANYRQYDGFVVSKTSTDSRNESADLLGRQSDNDIPTVDQQNNKKSDKPVKQTKTKSQTSNRRSIFFRHFDQEPPAPSESRYQKIDEDQLNFITEPLREVEDAIEPVSKSSKRFNPIEKGREFINDILMAKGRHRNRSHHHKGGGSGSGQVSKENSHQDSKKLSSYDLSSKDISQQTSVQNTYQISQKSKNIHERQNADGAAAAASTVVSFVSSATTAECADSGVINNLQSAQSPKGEENLSETCIDVMNGESFFHHQTVYERAPLQVNRENAADDQNIQEKAAAAIEDQKRLESDSVEASVDVEEFGDLNKDNLSELTECDRDRFIVECTEDMGQSQAKESTAPVSNSQTQLPTFQESHVQEEEQQTAKLNVPTIVIEDFGNVGESSTENSEIFYDTELKSSSEIEDHLLKIPEEDEDDDNEEGDDEDEEDQWHFVNNLQQNEEEGAVGSYQKTENSSDSNLSNNSDSGIATSENIAKVLLLESCDLINDRSKDPSPHRLRDGSATDCDENLPLCDDFDYFKDLPTVIDTVEVVSDDSHSGILIESISLPDVVESTTSNVLKNSSSDSVNSDPKAANSSNEESENVDNSGSVKMGNVHFIPIRVEKRRSIDDSVLMTKSANGGNLLYNGQQYNEEKSTLEITSEEEDENEKDHASVSAAATEEDKKRKRDLVDQESHFNAQLDDAQKNIYNLQSKVDELQSKIESLEKELSVKSWNVERLQGELGAAHKEDEFVRRKLRLLEDEKTTLRQKFFETEEELNNKYDELDRQYKELEEKYKHMQAFGCNLQTQLACAQSEAEQCRQEADNLRYEKDEQIRKLEEALATAKQEQDAMQVKWNKEFESLRTQNADREEHLMSDCEWQLRQMQRSCKDKLDKAEFLRREAIEMNQKIEEEAEEKLKEVIHLRSCEAEVKQLRGLTTEQENSIISMRDKIEELKAELITANENLEDQIENVRRIKYQCDNAIYDKERELLQKIDDVRNEAAAVWENKLITEMTRLKMELESVYVDERREELDKLQAEHLEELKALTTRYTANEEELRAEIAELRESLRERNEEFLNLREKSDNAILQTRMHLDRADRDYQTAMLREEEKREQLAESLRKELEAEKLEMEEKFRERLGQVQEEFNKELQTSTQELQEKHRKEMESQWQKLISEKESAIQELEVRHRKRLEDAEDRLHDTEKRHQHNLKDLKLMYDMEKASLDKRDMNNSQEIEQLHRKCKCLTNLFEEMRMRYERRDPRQEDLREISELRSRCEAQERDIFELTDRLREMQIQLEELQGGTGKKKSLVRKPPPKTIPTNCDVIYEENEERESPPRPMTSPNNHVEQEDDDEDDDEEENEEEDEDEEEDEENEESSQYKKNIINEDERNHPKPVISNNKTNCLNALNKSIM